MNPGTLPIAGSLHSPSSEDGPVRAPLSRRSPVLLAVLILVNAVAIWGQSGWAYEHITPPGWKNTERVVMALAFACAIELVGVYLAQMADVALGAGLPAGGLRWASYGMGTLAGALNFDHFRPWGLPAAVAFGFLSASSPFLWGVYAKLRHRVTSGNTLRRGVRLSPARKLWHPVRSMRVVRLAAWEGIEDEDQAVRAFTIMIERPTDDAPVSPAAGMTKVELGQHAYRLKTEAPDRTWASIADEMGATERWLLECRKAAGLA